MLGSVAAMAKPSPKKAEGPKPARMPKPPKAPSTELSDLAKKILDDDDQERRDAAKAYLDSDRAGRSAGLKIPDLPQKRPNPRD